MNKTKVLFLIESFIVGGAEKVLIDIVNNLDADKYNITVCSVFKQSVYKGYNKTFNQPFKSHIKYKYLINNQHHWLYLIFNFLLARVPNLLYQLMIGDKYDTIIAFYEGLPTNWIANAYLKRGKKIAWLHTSTELSQKGKSIEELEKQKEYYSNYKRIIAVSQGVADSFTKLFPTLEQSIKVIYNPINITKIQNKATYPIKLEKKVYPTFVCVGRMTEVKGYDRWLRVVLRLKNKGYKFQSWIIGGGNRKVYDQFVIDNKLTEYVLFLGHQDNPYPYMAKSDWIACPSYLEGLSTVVMEGIALGKAIIATDCPGMKELLGNNEDGIICENNEDDLVRTIENIINNKFIKYTSSPILKNITFSLEESINKIDNVITQD